MTLGWRSSHSPVRLSDSWRRIQSVSATQATNGRRVGVLTAPLGGRATLLTSACRISGGHPRDKPSRSTRRPMRATAGRTRPYRRRAFRRASLDADRGSRSGGCEPSGDGASRVAVALARRGVSISGPSTGCAHPGAGPSRTVGSDGGGRPTARLWISRRLEFLRRIRPGVDNRLGSFPRGVGESGLPSSCARWFAVPPRPWIARILSVQRQRHAECGAARPAGPRARLT